MAAREKKIVAGLILASIHLNLFGILLFPSCFGFAFLYFGIYDLERKAPSFPIGKWQRKLRHAAAALLVVSTGFGDFVNAFRSVDTVTIWALIPVILEYLVLFSLMENYAARNPGLSGLKRGYVISMGVSVAAFGVSLILHRPDWLAVCGVMILACRGIVAAGAWVDGKEV